MSGLHNYWRCPECGWDVVLLDDPAAVPPTCLLCFDDSLHVVEMRGRRALDTDKPEGPDDRL